MSSYTKDQSQHSDLPEAFRQYQEPSTPVPPKPSWDLILLGITLFLVMENNKKTSPNNNL